MTKKNRKFYAVKTGRKIGIFNTWAECEKQVKGYPGAEFLSFKSKDEALKYLANGKKEKDGKTIDQMTIDEIIIDDNTNIIAYVDGSYDSLKEMYSCGVVLFINKEKKTLLSKGNDPELVKMRNVSGEIMGSMMAMQYAIENKTDKIDRLIIHHDYEGIAKWCTGEWKANKKGTKDYKKFYMNAAKQIKIDFVKVKAHSGNKYNEEADQLAKKALSTDEDVNVDVEVNVIEEEIEKIINVKKSQKPKVHIRYKDEDIKIEDIVKKVKEVWLKKGRRKRKIKDINTLDIYINIDEHRYEWEIQTKDKLEKGEIYFSK